MERGSSLEPFNDALNELELQLGRLAQEWQCLCLLLIDAATDMRLKDPQTLQALQDILVPFRKMALKVIQF